ncbi:hypothetical protein [Bacillus toyonensis]|uniref:hypothetical protein n=1 Tax=Bacillus toyonensis TaxID=155322 RepID=UPI002E20C26B|nr:hypothetical protein [Bacillus toyonensis]
MRERENWDVLCEVCNKTIEHGVSTHAHQLKNKNKVSSHSKQLQTVQHIGYS